MEGKTLVFDLDRTLFDTEESGRRYKEALTTDTGLEISKYDQIYQDYKSTLESSTDFDPEELLNLFEKNLNIDREELEKKFWDGENFVLFPKVKEQLEELAKKNTLTLFSEGKEGWQLKKIKKTGIDGLFDLKESLIKRRKLNSEVVAKIPQEAVVIDDKEEVIKELSSQRPDLKLIWINRKDDQKIEGEKIRTIKSLGELI